MTGHDWRGRTRTAEELLELIESRLRDKGPCEEIVDSAEELLDLIWKFNAQLIGNDGIRAVFIRTYKLSGAALPLLQKVKVAKNRIDFAELRLYASEIQCDAVEIVDTILELAMVVIQIISEMTGEAMTAPMLQRLKHYSGPAERISGNGSPE